MSTTEQANGSVSVEKKLQRLHDNLDAVVTHVEQREYENAIDVAEDMMDNAEETGCSMCMKTAAGVKSGVVWAQVLPQDDDARRDALIVSVQEAMSQVSAEIDG